MFFESENAAGEQYVYVTSQPDKDGLATAKRIIIGTGKTQGDMIEVLSGLKNGDMIVEEGARVNPECLLGWAIERENIKVIKHPMYPKLYRDVR